MFREYVPISACPTYLKSGDYKIIGGWWDECGWNAEQIGSVDGIGWIRKDGSRVNPTHFIVQPPPPKRPID